MEKVAPHRYNVLLMEVFFFQITRIFWEIMFKRIGYTFQEVECFALLHQLKYNQITGNLLRSMILVIGIMNNWNALFSVITSLYIIQSMMSVKIILQLLTILSVKIIFSNENSEFLKAPNTFQKAIPTPPENIYITCLCPINQFFPLTNLIKLNMRNLTTAFRAEQFF